MSQARPQGTGIGLWGQRFAAGSGRHRYRSGFAIAMLVIVEACIGRTDLQQQAWTGEGAIMDGTRQVGMTADDVEGGGLFRSQQ